MKLLTYKLNVEALAHLLLKISTQLPPPPHFIIRRHTRLGLALSDTIWVWLLRRELCSRSYTCFRAPPLSLCSCHPCIFASQRPRGQTPPLCLPAAIPTLVPPESESSGLHPQPGWSTIILPSQPSGTAPISQCPRTQSRSSVLSWAGFVLFLMFRTLCLPTVLRPQIQVFMYAPACLDVTVTSSGQLLLSGRLPQDLPPHLKFVFVQKLLTETLSEGHVPPLHASASLTSGPEWYISNEDPPLTLPLSPMPIVSDQGHSPLHIPWAWTKASGYLLAVTASHLRASLLPHASVPPLYPSNSGSHWSSTESRVWPLP